VEVSAILPEEGVSSVRSAGVSRTSCWREKPLKITTLTKFFREELATIMEVVVGVVRISMECKVEEVHPPITSVGVVDVATATMCLSTNSRSRW
jgi:hypothetical protein